MKDDVALVERIKNKHKFKQVLDLFSFAAHEEGYECWAEVAKTRLSVYEKHHLLSGWMRRFLIKETLT